MIGQDRIKLFARVVVSFVVLGAALYIILSRQFGDDYAKWAFGMAGVIVGYWLR